ncbi:MULTISPECIES: glycoside hydrolase family 76 protein [unclassified Microbacterium]|uniref:glycoside hydrolase family 76 protein n=1 Tax=unclassified Microbacterium TaxID=2609290 RepID=UPI0016054E28|nr:MULTISPECIES: glycoside hydrolase family 76 protein [unclassified Microbacterium]QNA93513.1 hypothetical protein G4G29_16605 [Microbacterium sp. Se63.02b]QYM63761.1 hypothetical protein K1X59_16670 [Microbacterium sp. Se5.02b]
MTSTPAQTWSAHADVAQRSLDHFFGVAGTQYLANSHPHDRGNTEVFNYWWLAHVIDARVDAWARTADRAWLAEADRARANIIERNGGQLFNDYFDDMLWFALALERMHAATGEQRYLDEAIAIWDHVVAEGWNETLGWSLAWRKQQLAYKNTPANGPLAILGVRLSRVDASRDSLTYARTAFDWLTTNLVGDDGFVEDGINRNDDGAVDAQWRFTYNQGLYVGAAVELYAATGSAATSNGRCRPRSPPCGSSATVRCSATRATVATKGCSRASTTATSVSSSPCWRVRTASRTSACCWRASCGRAPTSCGRTGRSTACCVRAMTGRRRRRSGSRTPRRSARSSPSSNVPGSKLVPREPMR